MITFDARGVATPESQAFFEAERLKIVQDVLMSPSQKASRIRDLYNQYGMEQGTYNRKGQLHTDTDGYKMHHPSNVSAGDTSMKTTIIFTIVLSLVMWGIYAADHWFVDHNVKFSIAKVIERFFQWVFS